MSKTDDFDTTLRTIATTKFMTAGMVARLGWLSWSPHAKADRLEIGSQMHSSPSLLKLITLNSGGHPRLRIRPFAQTIIVDVLQ